VWPGSFLTLPPKTCSVAELHRLSEDPKALRRKILDLLKTGIAGVGPSSQILDAIQGYVVPEGRPNLDAAHVVVDCLSLLSLKLSADRSSSLPADSRKNLFQLVKDLVSRKAIPPHV